MLNFALAPIQSSIQSQVNVYDIFVRNRRTSKLARRIAIKPDFPPLVFSQSFPLFLTG